MNDTATTTSPMPNFTVTHIGDVTYWFSYETCIAVHTPAIGTIARQNDWRTVTGKHLNAVDGGDKVAKAKRLPGSEFVALLGRIVRNEV